MNCGAAGVSEQFAKSYRLSLSYRSSRKLPALEQGIYIRIKRELPLLNEAKCGQRCYGLTDRAGLKQSFRRYWRPSG